MRYWQHEDTGYICAAEQQPSPRWCEISREAYETIEATQQGVTDIEIDFSYANLPRCPVVEWAILPSGRIVAMTDQESFWFEPNGKSPKGSFLTPWPPNQSLKPMPNSGAV